ncbi:MAG: ketoacyl-ACP synthase III [Actinobacteria bacterium]|nr:ketoacyl-ACP synthase III [Actinomycetota bacterium]MBU1493224.1 ketoacyl-ACP synthase III [Actinomycetota bacterium]MBU1865101.1 ketoacyl-ACP synthase III [Actinomycetota bacterium]
MTARARIAGIGSYLPPTVVTNDDLAARIDTSDEWITQRTGIKQRRWVAPGITTSDLALEAARGALDDAGVGPEDLDMVFLATLSPDHEFPGTACFLQAKLDVPAGIPAIDVRQQCTGFVYAMSMADQYIRTGFASRVLVVGAEVHSKGLEMSDEGRDVTVLFGDGAGAVVVEATRVANPATDGHIYSTHLHADGRHAEDLWLPAPGMAYDIFMSHYQVDRGDVYPKMNGRAVYVNAVRRMGEAVEEVLAANDVTIDDVDLVVFHQANLRINEAVAERLGIPADKVFNTIDRYANTTAATIPIGLHEAVKAGRLEAGMLVAVAAFGSGFTWGSLLLRW